MSPRHLACAPAGPPLMSSADAVKPPLAKPSLTTPIESFPSNANLIHSSLSHGPTSHDPLAHHKLQNAPVVCRQLFFCIVRRRHVRRYSKHSCWHWQGTRFLVQNSLDNLLSRGNNSKRPAWSGLRKFGSKKWRNQKSFEHGRSIWSGIFKTSESTGPLSPFS